MGRTYSELIEKQSSFFRRLWQELSEAKVYDTHEHLNSEPGLWVDQRGHPRDKIPAYEAFDRAYVHGFQRAPGKYEQWAGVVRRQRGTGYVKAVTWAVEDLFGLSPPVTASYMEALERHLNEAYDRDAAEKNRRIATVFGEHMNVETAILNVSPLDAHLKMPQPTFQAAAGLPDICECTCPPKTYKPPGQVPWWFAKEKKGVEPAEIATFEQYLELIDDLLDWIANSKLFLCAKFQLAYHRPISFPEPGEDPAELRAVKETYGRPAVEEEELWRFGDHVLHHFLERMAVGWNRPVQFHTGLARMYDGGSNALNLSHLLRKFPDVKFDLFHGNFPWHVVLAGMLHQIPNVHADLCWLPIISPTAAKDLLVHLVEVGDMCGELEGHEPSWRTSAFGGDCAIAEGSRGALLVAKEVVCRAMEDLHERGHLTQADAVDVAERLLYENPKRLFGSQPT
ncbi:MAG: hypothetical protein Kow0069_23990 [Promethearchaeota archaeon]